MINVLSVAGKLQQLWGVLLAIIILLAMVTIHEFGHYLAGKALGFQINEFAVGFGPAIYKKRSKKTGELFALRVIPLGGYCAFEGEDEQIGAVERDDAFEEFQPASKAEETDEVKPSGAKFTEQQPWKRIIVLIAGATMNYLLALVCLFVMFGVYGCVHSRVAVYTGIEVTTPTMEENCIGYRDIVLSVNGKDIYMETDYISALSVKKAGDSVQIELLRK